MTTKTISAASNPALVNNLISDALAEEPQQVNVKIISPLDTSVTLPGGYINSTGEVVMDAEVRELNGKDEEAIARTPNIGKAFLTILERGTVRIGNDKVTPEILDQLLSGDRDMLLLSIFKVTFGVEPELPVYCYTCKDAKIVGVNIDEDIKVKRLSDPLNDRVFLVQGKHQEFTVQLPTGVTQKEILTSIDKTSAELNTILLENTVTKIDGRPVVGKSQVQNLGLVDRKNIIAEINKRIPGPQFDDLTVTCPDCDSEVTVPISLGSFFRI